MSNKQNGLNPNLEQENGNGGDSSCLSCEGLSLGKEGIVGELERPTVDLSFVDGPQNKIHIPKSSLF